MTGLERKSDIVSMASYAPLFVNSHNRAWNPDMIVFDNHRQAHLSHARPAPADLASSNACGVDTAAGGCSICQLAGCQHCICIP